VEWIINVVTYLTRLREGSITHIPGYQHPRYDQHAPRYDQLNFRYDQHVPFASVSTGGSADIFPGLGFRERVVDDVRVP
jgi:hypothetical protein